jgi:hypothetical protein
MSTLNFEELGDKIVAAAKTGGKDGFIIKMGRKTGKKIIDPLEGNVEEVVYDEEKRFYKHSMSAQDYKRYVEVRKQLAAETNEDKRIDLTLRLYEYLALKFLGMAHEDFVNADFDDIVVATLACDALFGSGNSTPAAAAATQQPQEIGITRRRPVRQLDAVFQEPKHTYYKPPDEE